MSTYDIGFPKLGILLENLPNGVSVFGFWIAFYGMIMAFAMVMGYLLAAWQAKRTGQDPDLYLDFALIAIPVCVVAARIYYVIFSWNLYKDNPLQIFNVRNGGLGIYGAVIAAIITAVIFSRVKKVPLGLLVDTGCIGLITGQIIGRWGNFFNREAFGGYAGNSLFAMELPWDEAKLHMSTEAALTLRQYISADNTILVHPTFLYESLWNLCLLIFLLIYTRHKKFDGELFCIYMAGYGLGRFWIESMRTDQLLLWGTSIPVSMIVAAVMVVTGIGFIFWKRRK
ncbi:prolipoprotein diacylglyceryl transferase [Acetivibrio ethanolgignens]|uniref:Phosphatidylglycerol--prolipoprotein diacylglyceryl transferase n=1 Tax=Acetivibrio ethanolgignens TaxID=290052 RepID=A0A0V8QDS2_9FIRM|nr:prolipoprotein diacylglyceryl transferase [Acetivibrio ethanolgignens]KSV58695.1 prolipoprotein diacylglyceryl transferase [Acetivibrio ethanolgignens]